MDSKPGFFLLHQFHPSKKASHLQQQEPTGTCNEWSLKPKIPSVLLYPHYLETNPLLPAREGRLERAGLRELEKVESLTGNIWIPHEGEHNCYHQEWEMQVQYLQRAGNSLWDCREEVCLPLFWGPHAPHMASLPSWKTTGAHWKINTTETERTATLWTLQLPRTALGVGGGEVSQSIHGCQWQ